MPFVEFIKFRDYNFYKTRLTEAKITRYLVSKIENFVHADMAIPSKTNEGNFLDISISPVKPEITMGLSGANSH